MDRIAEPEYMDLDDEAAVYANADFRDVNAAFVQRLLDVAGPMASARAVDLGTGPCDIPARVASARPGWLVAAVDASIAMLRLAHTCVQGLRVARVQADGKRLPFQDGVFDVVFSNSILHHISDTASFWSEVRRISHPGSIVFIRDLARPHDECAAHAIVSRYAGSEPDLLREEYYRSLLSSYTPVEVREQLRGAGLGMLEVCMASDRHLDVFGRRT